MESDKKLISKGKGPINIALVKYWGKEDEKNIIPLNNSLSITLDMNKYYTHISAELTFDNKNNNILILNNKEEPINNRVSKLIEYFRALSPNEQISRASLILNSYNTFPTSSGCASSASSMSCLVKVLLNLFDRENESKMDDVQLSSFARLGSGSACRSIFGGFVEWVKCNDKNQSVADQIFDEFHWRELRILLIIVSDKRKDISSTDGMQTSSQTSKLLEYRVKHIVPVSLSKTKKAIEDKDFNSLSELTMKESNNFHAICRDTYPTINYLNDTSNFIIKCCEKLNNLYLNNICGYTFDAGPNAFILVEEKNIKLVRNYFEKIFSRNEDEIVELNEKLEKIINDLCTIHSLNKYEIIEIVEFSVGGGAIII